MKEDYKDLLFNILKYSGPFYKLKSSIYEEEYESFKKTYLYKIIKYTNDIISALPIIYDDIEILKLASINIKNIYRLLDYDLYFMENEDFCVYSTKITEYDDNISISSHDNMILNDDEYSDELVDYKCLNKNYSYISEHIKNELRYLIEEAMEKNPI